MKNGLESLSSREYAGRVIIIGKDKPGKNTVVVYAITGRSPSSQARKIEYEQDAVWVKPIEEETVRKGEIDLLVYPALFFDKGIAVSNGKQTQDIKTCLAKSQNPVEVLNLALKKWDYEPDAPTFTPRISGCVLPQDKAALAIIRRANDGSSIKDIFKISLSPGEGKMIATYSGENKDPLPAFKEKPAEVKIDEDRMDDLAEAVYEALGPKTGRKDFRVSVVCAFSPDLKSNRYEIYVINRNERK